MLQFLDLICPSLEYKILVFQYEQLVSNMMSFHNRPDEVIEFLRKMQLRFYEPEQVILPQYENPNKLMIIGTGKAQAFKYLDSRARIPLGPFQKGLLIGDTSIIFGTPSTYSVETESYCNIGVIDGYDVSDVLNKYPKVKSDIRDEILWNPYDRLREHFIEMCRKHIPYLKNAEEDLLKRLYYQSRQQFLEPSQMLFECGDRCDSIYVVLNGVIDTVLTDGADNIQVLDIVGKGSVLGIDNVLTYDLWAFRAVNNTRMTACLLAIGHRTLDYLMEMDRDLRKAVHEYRDELKVQGMGQIDYIIETIQLKKVSV